jgi:hypothetical protein
LANQAGMKPLEMAKHLQMKAVKILLTHGAKEKATRNQNGKEQKEAEREGAIEEEDEEERQARDEEREEAREMAGDVARREMAMEEACEWLQEMFGDVMAEI